MTEAKTIAICGSMTFVDDMEALAADLEKTGYRVETPRREEAHHDWTAMSASERVETKRLYVSGHIDIIRASDFVLIANYSKHGLAGYVGPNALMEAAVAFALGTPVVLLNPPDEQPCRLEILAVASAIAAGTASSVGRALRDAADQDRALNAEC